MLLSQWSQLAPGSGPHPCPQAVVWSLGVGGRVEAVGLPRRVSQCRGGRKEDTEKMHAVQEGHSPRAGLEPGCMLGSGGESTQRRAADIICGFLTALGGGEGTPIALVGGLLVQGNPLGH